MKGERVVGRSVCLSQAGAARARNEGRRARRRSGSLASRVAESQSDSRKASIHCTSIITPTYRAPTSRSRSRVPILARFLASPLAPTADGVEPRPNARLLFTHQHAQLTYSRRAAYRPEPLLELLLLL